MLSLILKIVQRTLTNNSDVDWKVKVIDTGLNTMTGGRLKKLKNMYLKMIFFDDIW